MTFLPADGYVHGTDGAPVVVVPARVAHVLVHRAGLADYHRDHRGRDPQLDAVLVALKHAGYAWAAGRGFNPATSRDTPDALEARSAWLSTTEAARRLHLTPQAVTRAIREDRLPAQVVGGRYLLDPHDVEQWAAIRQRAA